MTRLFLTLLILLAGTSAAFAQVQSAEGGPIKVTGDTFVIDEAKGVATFSGNVEIVRTGLTVWAQKVVIEYGAGGPEDVGKAAGLQLPHDRRAHQAAMPRDVNPSRSIEGVCSHA